MTVLKVLKKIHFIPINKHGTWVGERDRGLEYREIVCNKILHHPSDLRNICFSVEVTFCLNGPMQDPSTINTQDFSSFRYYPAGISWDKHVKKNNYLLAYSKNK